MVVACEALKPTRKEYRNRNIFHIIEALLGRKKAEELKRMKVPLGKDRIPIMGVRDRHLHHSALLGPELVPILMMSSFQDPSFLDLHREVSRTTKAAIIAWLLAAGGIDL